VFSSLRDVEQALQDRMLNFLYGVIEDTKTKAIGWYGRELVEETTTTAEEQEPSSATQQQDAEAAGQQLPRNAFKVNELVDPTSILQRVESSILGELQQNAKMSTVVAADGTIINNNNGT
jgi:hypothetical protein